MKEIQLKDLLKESDIKELKEKMPQLTKSQQRLMVKVVLFQVVEKIIREKFPDMQGSEDCTNSILRKEFASVYLP